MLLPDSRTTAFELIRPPSGYRLDFAVLTTYTLDLEGAVLAAGRTGRGQGTGDEAPVVLRLEHGARRGQCRPELRGGTADGGRPARLLRQPRKGKTRERKPTMEYRRPRHAFAGNDAIAGESCAVRHRQGRTLAVTSPWIGFILIPVICSVACGMATSSETVVVDDTGGAPLSGNSRGVSPATAATLPNGSSLQATDEEQALSGRWVGTGYQPAVDSSWSIEITFGDDGIDIGYPSIPCGGHLQPVSVSGRRFEYRERLRFGLSECVNNGRVVLERTGPNALSYEWYGVSDTLDAAGSLTRRTSG